MTSHSGGDARISEHASAVAKSRGPVLLLILGAQFVVMVDASIVNVALARVQSSLGFSPAGVQAVVTAYATAFGGALILGGRIGDLVSHRRMFLIGMAGFVLTSAACGLAQDPTQLVIARAAQGLTAALLAPAALALLTTRFAEGPARNRALSQFAAISVLGFVGGLVLGGVLVDAFGWRAVFAINVPVGVTAVIAGIRALPPAARVPTRVDVLGAVLVTGAVALIVYAPSRGSESGFASPGFILPLAAGVVALALFVFWERRAKVPLVRLGMLRSRQLRTANLVMLTSGAMNGVGFLLSALYLQNGLGFSPALAGLGIAPMGLVGIVVGMLGSRVLGRLGVRITTTLATGLSAVAVALLALSMAPGGHYPLLLVGLIVMGLGFPLMSASSRVAASMGVADEEQGLAGGLGQTSFQVGTALGVAVLLTLAVDHSAGLGIPGPAATVAGYRLALLMMAAFGAAVAVLAGVGLRPTTREET